MLTGSRNQYVIRWNVDTHKYSCNARFNTQKEEWSDHTNSPHDSNQNVWKVDWPKIGGGGDRDTEITAEELFQKIIAWDKTNYLIGAGTDGSSDENATDGIVDNHAYRYVSHRYRTSIVFVKATISHIALLPLTTV